MPDVDVCHCYTVCISDHHKHQQVGRDQTECQYICEPTLLCATRRGKYDTVVTNLLCAARRGKYDTVVTNLLCAARRGKYDTVVTN